MIKISEAVYGALVNLYPEPYRQQFGDEMRYVFSEQMRETREAKGTLGVIGLWLRTFTDMVKSLVKEHNEFQRGARKMKPTTSKIHSNRMFAWLAALTAGVLLIPLIAMQFETGVNWDVFDFVVIGILIYGIGTLFILGARKVQNPMYRLAFGVLCFVLLLYVWAELAVGIFTNLGS